MDDTTKNMTGRLEEERASRRRFLRVFESSDGMAVLHELEMKFEVHLPVFQGSPGKFDPLDAMRRDSYREVFLYCRRKLELARDDSGREDESLNSLPNTKQQ